MGKFLNLSTVKESLLSVVAILLTLEEIASSNKLPTLALVPEILTSPSMRASNLSSCSEVIVTSAPSRMLNAKPAGKFVNEEPYLSIID